jgi:cytochrome bd ubiquinol oxidase subunit II
MILDYGMLRLIWWALLGTLLIGFAVTDGFDLGVAVLLPFVARKDEERRIVINTVGPVWEGNQVWLLLGAGAIFAAWPPLYAVAFSGFYPAMFLVLCALILRPVGFKYRSKITARRWRATWDIALFIGGLVPALVLGVAVGNMLEGVPFRFDETMRLTYEGTLFGLLNPFALLCGLVSVSMLVLHGANYLVLKAGKPVAARAAAAAQLAAFTLLALFTIGGLWAAFGLDGYAVTASLGPDGPSNPTLKQVAVHVGGLMANYRIYQWMIAAPVVVYVFVPFAVFFLRWNRPGWAFVSSGLAVAGVIATAGVSAFPFLLPSTLDPSMSLTVFDASSSRLTLLIMLIVTLVFLPIVLVYTAWVYRVLRGPVTAEWVRLHSKSAY